MPGHYRVQVRKPIAAPERGSEPYVFREIELTFPPFVGLHVDDFDGERFQLVEVIWREAQHRFVALTAPITVDGSDAVEAALRAAESRGWSRNRRSSERTAA